MALCLAVGWAFGRGSIPHEERRVVVGVRSAGPPHLVVGLIEPCVCVATLSRTTSAVEWTQAGRRAVAVAVAVAVARIGAIAVDVGVVSCLCGCVGSSGRLEVLDSRTWGNLERRVA